MDIVKFESKKHNSRQENVWLKNFYKFLIVYFNWLVVALAAVIFASGYFFFIKPVYLESKSINASNLSLEEDFFVRQQDFNKLKKLQESYDSISQNDKDKIDAMIPVGPDVEKLISDLESIVIKNGLVLSSVEVKVDEIKKTSTAIANPALAQGTEAKIVELPKNVGKINIKVNINGTDYNGLKNVIKTFENNLRLLDINNINFSAKDNITTLDLFTYYTQ